jgi:hypothetical protein
MLSPDVLYLIATEQQNDRIKEAAYQELLRAAELGKPRWQTHRKLAYQIGYQLQKWGTRLEKYGNGAPPSSETMPLKM